MDSNHAIPNVRGPFLTYYMCMSMYVYTYIGLNFPLLNSALLRNAMPCYGTLDWSLSAYTLFNADLTFLLCSCTFLMLVLVPFL